MTRQEIVSIEMPIVKEVEREIWGSCLECGVLSRTSYAYVCWEMRG